MLDKPPKAEVSMRSGEWVYFLHFPELRRVKIGTSRDPERRRQTLRWEHPELCGFRSEFVGRIDGGRLVERSIHANFRDARIKGEWFDESVIGDVETLVGLDVAHYD